MKIGVVSDTHRNLAYLGRVVDWLVKTQHVRALYHLGDDYDDVASLTHTGVAIVQVPGVYHPGYLDGTMPPVAWEIVLGLRVALVHALERDFSDESRVSADIVLHGHTHRAGIVLDDGKLYVNPGHLKGERDKNMPPGFALLELQAATVSVELYSLSFELVDSMELVRSENGLYKAS